MVDNVRDAMLNVECSSVTLMFVPIKAYESVQLIFLKGSTSITIGRDLVEAKDLQTDRRTREPLSEHRKSRKMFDERTQLEDEGVNGR